MGDMHYVDVAPNRLVRKDASWFTYSSENELPPGTIVTISIGKTSVLGIVVRSARKPPFATKPITSIVSTTPLPAQLIQLIIWISEYYQSHLSSAIQLIIPKGITKKRRSRSPSGLAPHIRNTAPQVPSPAQVRAIQEVTSTSATTSILFGVTGSGKTLVYKKSVQYYLSQGKSSLVLVPEIALTAQLVDEFRAEFGNNVIVTHSQMTEAERHTVWQSVLESTSPLVIIGPRSALFLPVPNIGLIILDEVHEPSYKQDQQPRYSALRVATKLAQYHRARAVFGSATPPLAEYYLAKHLQSPIVTLPERVGAAVQPDITTVDMKQRSNFTQHRYISNQLLSTIQSTLDNSQQVLLFHNRRGSTAMTICENCSWIAEDPETGMPLTLHADIHKLVSHITGFTMDVPTSCPICDDVHIIHKGIGTKLLESELRQLFPGKLLARFDGDGNVANSVTKRYGELYRGEIDIIIGTQVIAKGIDLPHLGAVGVIQADAGLALPDYTASERAFQLLSQVVGRVGRTTRASSVIIQTYQPDHYAIRYGAVQDYKNFYSHEISKRRREHFPPFCYLAKFVCVYKTEAASIANSRKLYKILKESAADTVAFLGPAPAFYEKQHGTYRWQIIAKSPIRSQLVSLISLLPANHWQYELDPINLL